MSKPFSDLYKSSTANDLKMARSFLDWIYCGFGIIQCTIEDMTIKHQTNDIKYTFLVKQNCQFYITLCLNFHSNLRWYIRYKCIEVWIVEQRVALDVWLIYKPFFCILSFVLSIIIYFFIFTIMFFYYFLLTTSSSSFIFDLSKDFFV